MKIFLRILRYVRPYWRRLALSIMCTVFYSVFSGASIYLSIPLLETLFDQSSSVVQQQTPPRNSVVPNEVIGVKQSLEQVIKSYIFEGSKTDSLFRICVVILIVFLLKNLFGYVQSYLMAYVEQGLMMDIRNELYRHLHNLSLSYFTNERTGNLISRVTNDVNVVNGGISASFVTLIREPLLVVVFLGIAFTLSWQLTLLSFIVFPFSLFIVSWIGVKLYK